MMKTFGRKNLRLLCTDTDSLLYEISQPQDRPYENIWNKLASSPNSMMVKIYRYLLIFAF